MKGAITSISAILSILCPQSVLAPPHDSSPTKRILVLGDSLSDGYPLPRPRAYPALLCEKLRTAGLNYEVTNFSKAGGTTDDGLRMVAMSLTRPIDIFILELGINDVFRGRSVQEIGRNLQLIIDQVKARNPTVRIVVLGLQLPNYSPDDYVGAFGKMYADLAAKNSAAYLPYLLQGVAGHPLLNSGDGIHPNWAGQKILARNVWQVLEPVAREVATAQSSGHVQ